MDRADLNAHLSQITTLWSVVSDAHHGTVETRRSACEKMVERYGGAILRYLRKSVRDADVADELYQEWAVRFVAGKMENADPNRGRFRDYLKTVLYHLIADHWSKQKRKRKEKPLSDFEPAADKPTESETEKCFVDSWRAHLLTRTWDSLSEIEKTTGQPVHTTLKIRVEHPNLRSPQLADIASEMLSRRIRADAYRQQLHRAREKFADQLIQEVAESLDAPTVEILTEELQDLRLYEYCRKHLAQP